jgi:transposase
MRRPPPDLLQQYGGTRSSTSSSDEAITRLDRTIAKVAQKDETAGRLMSIPGFGPITASAMAATIRDASNFVGPREFAA